ncbi:hypothetical protein EDF38_2640 [Frigoribacterium sp. PhB160]|uniref:hypothetical protein n=1 Tax=Frigoribacterium sp. PhB160 TaxID=2485192 RepID=UPI000F4A0BC3|nr:hypothetical protein [Frigoribacterium sp. PhB160]ROS57910.1 hypothetical protein EDF38_2640 [Frigoribacterium sp. PhB160]
MDLSTTPSPRSAAPRRRRPLRAVPALLAASVLLPGLLTACSSPAADEAASGATASDAATVGQCVRDAGYDVVDDDFGNSALVRLPDAIEPETDEADAFFSVVSDCHDAAGSASPRLSEGEKDAFAQKLVEMAQCLRDEGFENVPDPVEGVWEGPAEYEGDPAYAVASEKCMAGMKVAGR